MKSLARQSVFAFPDDGDVQNDPGATNARLQDGGFPATQTLHAPATPASSATAVIAATKLRRNPPRLLNFRELCILLDISERHARDLIAERKLPSIRLGARLLFDTAKIFAALERMWI